MKKLKSVYNDIEKIHEDLIYILADMERELETLQEDSNDYDTLEEMIDNVRLCQQNINFSKENIEEYI